MVLGMTDETEMLAAIARTPADDPLRLVYADALDEQGDPRGEVVRLEVEQHRATRRLATLQPTVDSQWLEQLRREPRAERRQFRTRDVTARLDELHLADHYPRERRFLLMQLDRELAARPQGLLVPQLEQIRAEAGERLETPLPREMVRARVRADWVPSASYEAGTTVLEVIWFQHGEDPFMLLSSFLAPIQWSDVALFEARPD